MGVPLSRPRRTRLRLQTPIRPNQRTPRGPIPTSRPVRKPRASLPPKCPFRSSPSPNQPPVRPPSVRTTHRNSNRSYPSACLRSSHQAHFCRLHRNRPSAKCNSPRFGSQIRPFPGASPLSRTRRQSQAITGTGNLLSANPQVLSRITCSPPASRLQSPPQYRQRLLIREAQRSPKKSARSTAEPRHLKPQPTIHSHWPPRRDTIHPFSLRPQTPRLRGISHTLQTLPSRRHTRPLPHLILRRALGHQPGLMSERITPRQVSRTPRLDGSGFVLTHPEARSTRP